jgi:hypothetical protein
LIELGGAVRCLKSHFAELAFNPHDHRTGQGGAFAVVGFVNLKRSYRRTRSFCGRGCVNGWLRWIISASDLTEQREVLATAQRPMTALLAVWRRRAAPSGRVSWTGDGQKELAPLKMERAVS